MSTSTEADDLRLPLAETIRRIRSELIQAIEQAKDEPVQFSLGEVELELKIGLTRETSVKGETKLWVLQLGGSYKTSAADVHVLKLRLTPVKRRTKPTIAGELRVSSVVESPSE